jgi:cell division protein FtsQ
MRRVNAVRRRLRRGVLAAGLFLLLPLLVAAGLYGSARLREGALGADLLREGKAHLLRDSAALGFALKVVAVEGRHWTKPAEIMKALAARPAMPIFAVDLAAAQTRLEALPWVRSAVIERRLPDTIFIRLSERRPLALWQHDAKMVLIDRRGTVIAVKSLHRFAKLPLVVGADARRHAAPLIAMLAQEPALAARVTAAIWVGGRRWNLRLDNAIDVLLPETGTASAWSELARIERSGKVLERDIAAIDLRLPGQLVVRINAPPAKSRPAGKEGGAAAKKT